MHMHEVEAGTTRRYEGQAQAPLVLLSTDGGLSSRVMCWCGMFEIHGKGLLLDRVLRLNVVCMRTKMQSYRPGMALLELHDSGSMCAIRQAGSVVLTGAVIHEALTCS